MKKLVSILLVLIICFCINPISTLNSTALSNDEYTYGYYRYTLNNNNATITEYTGTSSTVVIPDYFGEYPVTTIASNSFSGCYNLMNVTIPDSVRVINDYAFMGCENLMNVYIGKGVYEINGNAFGNCQSLVNISVANENLYFSSSGGVLFNKLKTELLKYPDGANSTYSIPSHVTKIGQSAFYSCYNLKKVTIPDSVTEIGDFAFFGCLNLDNLSIGEGVTKIGKYAFGYCEKIIEVVIPNNTQVLDEGAFAGCYNLEWVTLGSGLTTINSMAFAYCHKLISVKIPNKVTKILPDTFLLCTTLLSVTIPESVTQLSQDAFTGCQNLSEIEVAEGNPNYSSQGGVLFNKTVTDLILYPNWNFHDYVIPKTVTAISNYAFSECVNLKSIIIPKSVVKIGSNAFYGCENLIEVYYEGNENDWSNISIANGNEQISYLVTFDYCPHNYELEKWVKATYSAAGYKQYRCTNCKITYKINLIRLKRTSIADAKVSGVKKKAYTGKAITQSVKVTLKSKTLKKNIDYTVSYKDNKSTGKAKVIIKGKGAYEGTITKTFIIYPKKATIKSLKSSNKKQMKLTWKKDKKASGYKIVYATNSKFTKNKKTITVKGYKTYKKTIKKLKSNKTYYVKIRAYKTVGGKKYYGAYSKVKKVKVK